jgi:hypothetical protein
MATSREIATDCILSSTEFAGLGNYQYHGSNIIAVAGEITRDALKGCVTVSSSRLANIPICLSI